METARFLINAASVIAIILLTMGRSPLHAQQMRIEGVFPRQLPRGQVTLINVAVPSRDEIQAVQIVPSAGVKVSSIKRGQNFQGAMTWSELTIEVAQEAEPGDRTLEIVLPMGRTAPATIRIPSHVPKISELRVLSAQSNPPSLEVQFSAVDVSADLGESPYVWFMVGCKGDLLPGVVHGKLTARDIESGVVRVSVPNRSTLAGGSVPPHDICDLQVRLTDLGGIESNTLKTAIDVRK
jgi:hypothetical protein